MVVRLRRRAGDGWIGEAMDCFYCLSVWTAAPVAAAVARNRREAPLTWLALSGAACLLERATEKGDIDVLWEQAQEDASAGARRDRLWRPRLGRSSARSVDGAVTAR